MLCVCRSHPPPTSLHDTAAHYLAVLLDPQVGVVRGEDGGVRARQALEGVEAVLAEHGVGWPPPVPTRGASLPLFGEGWGRQLRLRNWLQGGRGETMMGRPCACRGFAQTGCGRSKLAATAVCHVLLRVCES